MQKQKELIATQRLLLPTHLYNMELKKSSEEFLLKAIVCVEWKD